MTNDDLQNPIWVKDPFIVQNRPVDLFMFQNRPGLFIYVLVES